MLHDDTVPLDVGVKTDKMCDLTALFDMALGKTPHLELEPGHVRNWLSPPLRSPNFKRSCSSTSSLLEASRSASQVAAMNLPFSHEVAFVSLVSQTQ